MKKNDLPLLLVLVVCLTLGACSGAAQPSSDPAPADSADLVQRARAAGEANAVAPDGSIDAESQTAGRDGVAPPAGLPGGYDGGEVKMIYQAEVSLQTVDFTDALSALERLAQELGGYFERSSTQGGSFYEGDRGQRYGLYTIRIPGEAFQSFLSRVGEAGHLVSSSSYATDIGAEYRDTEMRLATLETKRERLLTLLEQAEVMEDIIALENALSEAQYQIDQYASTLKRYDALVNYSTVHVSLSEVIRIEDEPGQGASLLTRLGAALSGGLSGFAQGAADLAVAAVYHLPVIVLSAALLFVGIRLFARLRGRKGRPGGDSDGDKS